MKNQEQNLRESFSRIKYDMNNLYQAILDVKKEVELLREVTTRTTTRSNYANHYAKQSFTTRSNLKSIQKKALNLIDTAQLKKAIAHYIDEGYKTAQIRDEVMNRFNIKPTCFYKYLKMVRELLREVTTRTTTR